MTKLLFALALSIAPPGAALAHSPMIATSPPDAITVAAPPTEIAMTFDAPVRLTKVTLALGEGSAVALDLSGAKSFASAFKIPCAISESGLYKVTWRALAQDGHVMKGDLRFKVK